MGLEADTETVSAFVFFSTPILDAPLVLCFTFGADYLYIERRNFFSLFIWDFVASTVMDDLIDWFYGQLVGFWGISLPKWVIWAWNCLTWNGCRL